MNWPAERRPASRRRTARRSTAACRGTCRAKPKSIGRQRPRRTTTLRASPVAAARVAVVCAAWRGRLRAAGVRAGPLQGHSHRAPQAGVRGVPDDLPGCGAGAAGQPRRCRRRIACPRDGQQVLRPSAAVPAKPDLWARGRGDRPLHDGWVGRASPQSARPAGGGTGALRAGRSEGARRRHAGEGAGAW